MCYLGGYLDGYLGSLGGSLGSGERLSGQRGEALWAALSGCLGDSFGCLRGSIWVSEKLLWVSGDPSPAIRDPGTRSSSVSQSVAWASPAGPTLLPPSFSLSPLYLDPSLVAGCNSGNSDVHAVYYLGYVPPCVHCWVLLCAEVSSSSLRPGNSAQSTPLPSLRPG